MAVIVFHTPSERVAVRLLDTTEIGRLPYLPIVLKYAHVGKHHARITRSPEGWAIRDLLGINGTYLNRARIPRGPTRLASGDELVFAEARATFLDDVDATSLVVHEPGKPWGVVIDTRAVAPTLDDVAARVTGKGMLVAIEAHWWLMDVGGAYVGLSAVYEDPSSATGFRDELLTEPHTINAAWASANGQRIASRFGAPFVFESPTQSNDACPRWWERARAIACSKCGVLIREEEAALQKSCAHFARLA